MAENSRQRRSRVKKQAQEWLARDPLILDTETTGLRDDDEIVSVGLIDREGNEVYHSLVRPTKRIPPDATAIHGITDADVRDAPTGGEVITQLTPLLLGRPICIYNADFEKRMLWQTANAWKVPAPTFEPLCIMKLFSEYAGAWHETFNGWRWWKLPDALAVCGLQPRPAHEAVADARASLDLLDHVAIAPLHTGKMEPPGATREKRPAREPVVYEVQLQAARPRKRGWAALSPLIRFLIVLAVLAVVLVLARACGASG
jgi:DNA polymerase III epsilon subunit-like protein